MEFGSFTLVKKRSLGFGKRRKETFERRRVLWGGKLVVVLVTAEKEEAEAVVEREDAIVMKESDNENEKMIQSVECF